MLGVYMFIHAQQLLQQSQLWLGSLKAGQAWSREAMGQLVLALFEAFTVSISVYLLHGLIYGLTDDELADRSFIVIAICQPIFQNLKAAVSPEFLAVERTWWALEASMMLMGVLFGATPVYSALQLTMSAPLLT